MKFLPSPLLLLVLAALFFPLSPQTRAGQTDIEGPEGSGQFGSTVKILPNGNMVVTDPSFIAPGPVAGAGAVHLYSPAGVLISTLTGSRTDDKVGLGGVKVLANGNYVVISHAWNRETGAVTWGHRDTGVSGVVSAENSLTGARFSDMAGGVMPGVTALSNGNYVVRVPNWRNGGNFGAGAVTWGNGIVGTAGVISSANSLVGSVANDQVGTVTALKNGDYVVTCPQWSNGGLRYAGAVVWCDGDTGRRGPVSTENALFGTAAQNRVGSGDDLSLGGPVVELANGNFVVVSPQWSNGTLAGVGAVTWCPAGSGLIGPVSEANSLTGSSPGDLAGGGGMATGTNSWQTGAVTALSDGNYAVASPLWDKPGVENSGAVTWCDGSAGMTGKISAAGSLTGSTAGDCIGGGGLAALANGHYAVCSPLWNRTSDFGSGAVTLVRGGSPFSGNVSAENSLTGTGLEAHVTVLANDNYVVCSPLWHNRPGAFRAGAVTWCAAGAGLVGAVSPANSLVGTSLDDHVGADTMEGSTRHPGVVALRNGNYVVRSVLWDKGDIPDAGAVTWCDGTTGRTGPLAAANSLTGSTAMDRVGEVTSLRDGNYVVGCPYWDLNGAANAGAVTWCDGAAGRAGEISTANSITGSNKDDLIGLDGVEALSRGYYVFSSRFWKNGKAEDAGAVTLGKSGGGTAGLIDLTNSVLGTGFPYVAAPSYGASFSGDLIAAGRPRANSVVVFSYAIQSAPELTVEQPQTIPKTSGDAAHFGSVGTGGSAGTQFIIKNTGYASLTLNAEVLNNPAFSTVTAPPATMAPGESAPLIVLFKPVTAGAQSALLKLSTNDPDRKVFEINLTGTGNADSPSKANDLAGPPGSGQFGYSVAVLPNGGVVVTDPFFDLPGPVKDAGAVYLYSAAGMLVTTLTGGSAYDRAGSGGVTVLTNGNFVIRSPYWSSATAPNAGAITWGSGAAGVSGVISAENSLVGSTAGDLLGDEFSSFEPGGGGGLIVKNIPYGVTALPGGNYVVCSTHWDAGPAAANAGAVTWGEGIAGTRGVVSSLNSLTGSQTDDWTGSRGIILLSNGNYVINSPHWNTNRGAVTWGAGASGVRGVINLENSLLGSKEYEQIGLKKDVTGDGANGVSALTNGHYAVGSSYAFNRAGAVTWCNGFIGARGTVTAANSLTGSTEGDVVGSGGITPMKSGDYVVSSPNWKKTDIPFAGAVTRCDGAAGLSGPVTAANSLTGSSFGDNAGSGGITEMSDERYAVSSPLWHNENAQTAGAVTWGVNATGLKGAVISPENSLTGSVQSDMIGSGGVTALPGGACVVVSPSWRGNRGAVTWCAPGTGAGMTVEADNSLTGKILNERIGSPGVTVLSSGNYVIGSSGWSTGGFPDVGALTWCRWDAAPGREISAANSLVGTKQGDMIGGFAGGGVKALSGGNYLVAGYIWDNGALQDAGAVAWGDGLHGVRGAVSAANSLTGTTAFGHTGEKITVFGGGFYAVLSSYRTNGSAAGAGAVTFAVGDSPPPAVVTSTNSVMGAAPGMGPFLNTVFRENDGTFITGRPGDNLVTLFQYLSGTGSQISVSRQDQSNGVAGNFGEVETGRSASLEFTVTNTGSVPVTLERVTATGPPFTVTAPALAGVALTSGESAVFTVTFTPAGAGLQSAELYLTGSRPPGSLLSRLTLTGVGKTAGETGAPFGENGGAPQAERLADGRVRITFKVLPGAKYLLQRSTDLEAWTPGLPFTAGLEGTVLWLDESPPPGRAYYRLKIP